MGNMFSFISQTWNPLGGHCSHECTYGWCTKLIEQRKMPKYQGKPYVVEKELERSFAVDEFVFVQDMTDFCAGDVPDEARLRVLEVIRNSKATFLLLSKNPRVYLNLIEDNQVPLNVILGVTLESNLSHWTLGKEWFYRDAISKAPSPSWRLQLLKSLANVSPVPLFIAVEPVLDFSLGSKQLLKVREKLGTPSDSFAEQLIALKPWAVAVGYDNYDTRLPEPPLEKTLELIKRLEDAGVKVYKKTLRKAWYE